MQALTIDEVNWLILIVKNQRDFAPENDRKLKIKVLTHLKEKKRELAGPGANNNGRFPTPVRSQN
jgi:hypothetical protein